MGLSTSAGTAVIFVGVFLMLGVIVPGTMNAYDLVTSAGDERNQLHMDRQHTDIEVSSVVAENGTIAVNVTNSGSTSLELSKTDVIVDNTYTPVDNVSVSDLETDLWLPGETATFVVEANGSDTLVVVTQYGNLDRVSLEEES